MKNQKNKKSVRRPVDVYTQCPSCKSKNIIPVVVDVICGDCDWMSCEEHAQGGGMDDLVAAFCEHFVVTPEAVILPSGKNQINLGVAHLSPSSQAQSIEVEEPYEIEVSA